MARHGRVICGGEVKGLLLFFIQAKLASAETRNESSTLDSSAFQKECLKGIYERTKTLSIVEFLYNNMIFCILLFSAIDNNEQFKNTMEKKVRKAPFTLSSIHFRPSQFFVTVLQTCAN